MQSIKTAGGKNRLGRNVLHPNAWSYLPFTPMHRPKPRAHGLIAGKTNQWSPKLSLSSSAHDIVLVNFVLPSLSFSIHAATLAIA